MRKILWGVVCCVSFAFSQNQKPLHYAIVEYEVSPCYTNCENPSEQVNIKCGSFWYGSHFRPAIGFKNSNIKPGSAFTETEIKYFSNYLTSIFQNETPEQSFVLARTPVVKEKMVVLAAIPVEPSSEASKIKYGFVGAPLALEKALVKKRVEQMVVQEVFEKAALNASGCWTLATLVPLVLDGKRRFYGNPKDVEKYGKPIRTHHIIEVNRKNHAVYAEDIEQELRKGLPTNDIVSDDPLEGTVEEIKKALNDPIDYMNKLILKQTWKELCYNSSKLSSDLCTQIKQKLEQLEKTLEPEFGSNNYKDSETLLNAWLKRPDLIHIGTLTAKIKNEILSIEFEYSVRSLNVDINKFLNIIQLVESNYYLEKITSENYLLRMNPFNEKNIKHQNKIYFHQSYSYWRNFETKIKLLANQKK